MLSTSQLSFQVAFLSISSQLKSMLVLLILPMVLCHQVVVKQGLLTPRSPSLVSHRGKRILSYLGIPYGAPPEGERRFQLPQAAPAWEGVLQADQSISCPQWDDWAGGLRGREDCLVINVHVTEEALRMGNTPVMVWIHGGGFVFGDGTPEFYGPEWLLDFGVIMVTINYRLGALGFLSTGDQVGMEGLLKTLPISHLEYSSSFPPSAVQELPGNLGLWDQRLALLWVQSNIGAFGGDPARVTIAGESAGSMSVLYHVLSPQSAGLFQAAIGQSGVPGSSFTHTDHHPGYYARSLASAVGCSPTSPSPVLRSCLQALPADSLVSATKAWDQTGLLSLTQLYFKPVVDDFSADPFLPRDPHDILLGGDFNKVPIILGYNKDEGLGMFLDIKDRIHGYTVKNLAFDLLHREEDEVDDKDRQFVALYLEDHFQGRPLGPDMKDKITEMYTDSLFLASVHSTAALLSRSNPDQVFLYRYSHQGTVSVVDLFSRLSKWQLALRVALGYLGYDIFTSDLGTAHVDDVLMLFKAASLPLKQRRTEEDLAVSELLLSLWTNFIKHGRPSEEWRPLDADRAEHYELGPDPGMVTDLKVQEKVTLWHRLWQLVPPSLHLKRAKSWGDLLKYKNLEHLFKQEL